MSIRVRHRVPDALHLADQAVRHRGKVLPGARDGGGGGDGAVAGRGHQLHELRERGGTRRIRGLRLPDVDEPAADDQPLADGVEQVAGSRDDVVRAADVGGRGRERPGERDERVVREEALEAVEAPAGRGQVGVERVHRGPVDPQARLLDPVDHRLEVGPQRARLVERRQVSERGKAGGQRDRASRTMTAMPPSTTRRRGRPHRRGAAPGATPPTLTEPGAR